MDQINRENLGDAVAQFLASGGAIEQCEAVEEVSKAHGPIRRRRGERRASGVAITNPYDVPLSLTERQHEAEVRRCADSGFNMLQTIKETQLSRNTILRLCREFGFSLRGARPVTDAQIAQALREAYQRGTPHAVICARLELDMDHAASLYADFLSKDPSEPPPPVVDEGSDASILSKIVLGMSHGFSLLDVIKMENLDYRRASRVYDRHQRRIRRLL